MLHGTGEDSYHYSSYIKQDTRVFPSHHCLTDLRKSASPGWIHIQQFFVVHASNYSIQITGGFGWGSVFRCFCSLLFKVKKIYLKKHFFLGLGTNIAPMKTSGVK